MVGHLLAKKSKCGGEIGDALLSNAQHSQDYFVISSCRIHAENEPSKHKLTGPNDNVKLGQKGPGWNGKPEIVVPSNLLPTVPKWLPST